MLYKEVITMAGNFKKVMLKRILIFVVVIAFLFTFDGARIFYLQFVKGDELSAKAESQQLLDTEVSAMRGTIYDADGNVLAQSATVYNIYIDPSNISSEEKRTLVVDGLAKILDFDDEEKEELLEKSKKDTKYVVIAEKVEYKIKQEISSFVSENKLSNIVGTEQTTKRYYPYGSFASSVIGFTGDDNQGLSGIESYYDEELTGTNGRIISVKDSKGNKLPTDYETSIDAVDGNSLVLTINQTIQYYLEKELRTALEEYQCKGAYGIVMNCNTGAILGMASLPDYDCNDPYEITYDKYEKELEEIDDDDEYNETQSAYIQNQWRNFTVSDTYVPGSVFKVFTASAALEEGVVDENFTYTCGGSIQVADRTMNCHYHAGHGTQTLTQGLMNSCNPFFITVGQKLGVKNYFKYFEAFGFTQKTGVDLPGEASPQYYTEDQYGLVELSSASFGQTNSLTPIQVCSGIAAIANGGTLLQPYVVSEVKDANGNTVSKTETTEVRRVISEDTAKTVRTMMKAVVDDGTGKNGYVAGYSVAGKTGTSTKLGESKEGEATKYIVSFAAIAPSDDPQIAMLIICDEPNVNLGGGALCAPIAATVIEQAMEELNIEPKYDDDETALLSISTPNVIGNELETAKSTLTNSGLTYKVVGSGSTIVDQNPSSTSTIPSGGCVVLYTEKNKKSKVKVPDFTGLTVSEANSYASANNINIELSGNSLSSSNIVAYRQSVEAGTEVEEGTVVTVTFKSTVSVLD
jgi:stage V sporulation protein D (sporulation-specific penicillin-binding protein)